MGCIILCDPDQGRAVLYDTVTETALPCPGFVGFGTEAYDMAEDFNAWVDGDPRRHSGEKLRELYGEWHDEAHDQDGNFIGTEKGQT